MSGWGWEELVALAVFGFALWLVVSAELLDREARQDAEHRASWLPPRTDPVAAERLRDQ